MATISPDLATIDAISLVMSLNSVRKDVWTLNVSMPGKFTFCTIDVNSDKSVKVGKNR